MGIILTSLSAVVIITFMVVELFGELENPYIGLFAYVLMPVLFVHRSDPDSHRNVDATPKTASEQAPPTPKRPSSQVFDFNDPKIRRTAIIIIALTAINAVIFGASSFHRG